MNELLESVVEAHGGLARWTPFRKASPIHDHGTDDSPIVFIVDPEPSQRKALARSATTCGWHIREFHSVEAFQHSPPLLRPSCLVLQATASELDVLDLQERVAIDRPGMPIILITPPHCAPAAILATTAASIRLLPKPDDSELLIDTIAGALERGRPAFARWARTQDLRSRYDNLTAREREVMALVVHGRLNKQVGGDLGISEITVKAHRGNVMRKMRASSFASLVSMAARLGMVVPEDDFT